MPQTHTITTYSLAELKEQFPDAYKKVHERWARGCAEDVAWVDETMDSLRAVIEACNGSLKDWSIGAFSPCHLRVSVQDDGRNVDWFRREVLKPLGYTKRNGHAEFPGHCKLTGYCADDTFLEETYKALKRGDTLTEALEGLADVAGRMMEADLEQQEDEETMEANWGESQFDETGRMV